MRSLLVSIRVLWADIQGDGGRAYKVSDAPKFFRQILFIWPAAITGPVGTPVGEPPAGSSVTASVSASSSLRAIRAAGDRSAFPDASTRPSEIGALVAHDQPQFVRAAGGRLTPVRVMRIVPLAGS